MIGDAPILCDVCRAPHRSVNGWYTVKFRKLEIVIKPFTLTQSGYPAVCGENCLGKIISQNLGGLHGQKVADNPTVGS